MRIVNTAKRLKLILFAIGLGLVALAVVRLSLYFFKFPAGTGFDFYYYAIQAREIVSEGELYFPTPFFLVFLLDASILALVSDPVVAVKLVTMLLALVVGVLSALLVRKIHGEQSVALYCSGVALLSPTLTHFTVEYRKTLIALVIVMGGFCWAAHMNGFSTKNRITLAVAALLSHGVGVMVAIWLVASSERLWRIVQILRPRRRLLVRSVLLALIGSVAIAVIFGPRHYTIQGHPLLAALYVALVCVLHSRAIFLLFGNHRMRGFVCRLAIAVSVTTIVSGLLGLLDLGRYTNDVVDRVVLFHGVAQLLPLVIVLRKFGLRYQIGSVALSIILISASAPQGVLMAETYAELERGATELVLSDQAVVIAPPGINFWLGYRYRVRSAKEIENVEDYDIFVWTRTTHLPCLVWGNANLPIIYRNGGWVIVRLDDYQRCVDA